MTTTATYNNPPVSVPPSQFERLVEWANYLELSPSSAFKRLSKLLGTDDGVFGVESVCVPDNAFNNCETPFAAMRYLNTGDTYSETIIHDRTENTLIVSTWGDWYETNEREYQIEN